MELLVKSKRQDLVRNWILDTGPNPVEQLHWWKSTGITHSSKLPEINESLFGFLVMHQSMLMEHNEESKE